MPPATVKQGHNIIKIHFIEQNMNITLQQEKNEENIERHDKYIT